MLRSAIRHAFALLLPLACLAGTARGHGQTPRLGPSAVPVRGVRPEAFAPAGWRIAAQAQGDLNGDGHADRVLQLVPRAETNAATGDSPEAQALVILLAASGGGWRRGGVATGVLVTEMPQWALGLAIRRGVLVVSQQYGWADVWNITHRFRLHAASGRFVLIGRDQQQFHRPNGMYDTVLKSENYLTGVRLVTIGHLRPGGTYRDTVQRRRIPRSRIAFEDVAELEDG